MLPCQVGVACMDAEHAHCTEALNAMLNACAPAAMPDCAAFEVIARARLKGWIPSY